MESLSHDLLRLWYNLYANILSNLRSDEAVRVANRGGDSGYKTVKKQGSKSVS